MRFLHASLDVILCRPRFQVLKGFTVPTLPPHTGAGLWERPPFWIGQTGDVYPTGANVHQNPSTFAEGNDTPGRSGNTGQPKNKATKPKHTQRRTQKRPLPEQKPRKTKRKKDEPMHEKGLPGQTQFGSGPPYVACGYQYRQGMYKNVATSSISRLTRGSNPEGQAHPSIRGVLVRRKHRLHAGRQGQVREEALQLWQEADTNRPRAHHEKKVTTKNAKHHIRQLHATKKGPQ